MNIFKNPWWILWSVPLPQGECYLPLVIPNTKIRLQIKGALSQYTSLVVSEFAALVFYETLPCKIKKSVYSLSDYGFWAVKFTSIQPLHYLYCCVNTRQNAILSKFPNNVTKSLKTYSGIRQNSKKRKNYTNHMLNFVLCVPKWCWKLTMLNKLSIGHITRSGGTNLP